MSSEVWTDKGHKPALEDIVAALGPQKPIWEELAAAAVELGGKPDIVSAGKEGWAVRFRKGGKALITLAPTADCVKVQIVLGEGISAEAFELELGKRARQALEAAHPYPDGRWLFFLAKTKKDRVDVRRLMELKARPGRK